jgi:hypothetical protein
MRVFYYTWTDGRVYLIACFGSNPSRLSPVWQTCNACGWMVPGTWTDEPG